MNGLTGCIPRDVDVGVGDGGCDDVISLFVLSMCVDDRNALGEPREGSLRAAEKRGSGRRRRRVSIELGVCVFACVTCLSLLSLNLG